MYSKKLYEKKLREEEEATAHVFQDFLTSFQDLSNTPGKVFIKSGVLNPDSNISTSDSNLNQIYLPKPFIIQNKKATIQSAIECAKILKDTKIERNNKNKEKRLSNLELLKEEIKQRQLENLNIEIPVPSTGYDPNTTNLFIANLSPKVTEEELMLLFGKYGALASVKIMWPRGEERNRCTNCGFVAYMSRKDAERAILNLKNRDDMRISWGKCVEIPPLPIYIPPELTKTFLPPPYSGLPFNSQPADANFKHPQCQNELEELLYNSVVKVTIPLDKKMLVLIHRVVEFVVREGPLFEAMLMMNEGNNPDFSFLFDFKSPLHVYYRWKLYSILNYDTQKSWSQKPFRMYKNGPIWVPPIPIDYSAGMPDDLINLNKTEPKYLTEYQFNRLNELIHKMDASRCKICAVTICCMNHKASICDSLEFICDAVKNASSPVKQIARFYLLSDILINCKKKYIDVKLFDTKQNYLKDIAERLRETYKQFKLKFDKEEFNKRIKSVFQSWKSFKVFSCELIEELENTILVEENEEDDNSDEEIEPLDGANLLKRSKILDDTNKENDLNDQFILSAWNQVDPNILEEQAMSTKKLYELELKKMKKEIKKKKKKKKSRYSPIVTSKWDDSDYE